MLKAVKLRDLPMWAKFRLRDVEDARIYVKGEVRLSVDGFWVGDPKNMYAGFPCAGNTTVYVEESK